ncbi:hypothetical protein [Streptomyces acidiscabies]|uniref:hypothetical protein n=1 Tax=Streptomyces acidiscabies TaxID=42234 RepID=UPI00117D0FBA|nr:hypothetical protein [Streptomyces acidiscabies]
MKKRTLAVVIPGVLGALVGLAATIERKRRNPASQKKTEEAHRIKRMRKRDQEDIEEFYRTRNQREQKELEQRQQHQQSWDDDRRSDDTWSY